MPGQPHGKPTTVVLPPMTPLMRPRVAQWSETRSAGATLTRKGLVAVNAIPATGNEQIRDDHRVVVKDHVERSAKHLKLRWASGVE